MTEADRIYRAEARRRLQEEEAKRVEAARSEAQQIVALRQRIGRAIPGILEILKSKGYPDGELIAVTRYGAIRGEKTKTVAAWLLHTQTTPWQDTQLQWKFFLTSRGKLAGGASGRRDYLKLNEDHLARFLPGIAGGLERLRAHLSSI